MTSEASGNLPVPGGAGVDLATLRPEVAKMMKEGALEGRFRVGELFDLLKEAEAVDIQAEASTSRANKFGCLFLALAFGSFFLGPLAVVLGPLFGIGCIYQFVMSSRYSSYDVPDDFRISFLPVLDALRNDIPKKTRVRCDLDLTKAVQPRKEIQKPDSGWQGTYMFSKECRNYYQDSWCLFQSDLADGSQLQLEFWNEILELIRIRGRKNKRKYKYKKVSCVRVTVVPKGGKFAWDEGSLQTASSQGSKVKSKEKQGESVFSLVHKTKAAQRGSCPDEGIPPAITLGLVMKLYTALTPRAREGAQTHG